MKKKPQSARQYCEKLNCKYWILGVRVGVVITLGRDIGVIADVEEDYLFRVIDYPEMTAGMEVEFTAVQTEATEYNLAFDLRTK